MTLTGLHLQLLLHFGEEGEKMGKDTTTYAGVIETELKELEYMNLKRENIILSFTVQYSGILTLVCC